MMIFTKFSNFLALFILFAAAVFQEPALAIKKSYVVYLGAHSHGPEVTSADLERVTDSHTDLLSSFVGSKEKAKEAIFYSYDRHINGFAALLEEEEAAEIAKHPNVLSVFLNKGRKLHTTHSWDFLNLEKYCEVRDLSIWSRARYGEDTIIANLDTGVWPESKSFSDDGIGPIPSKWRGICQFAENNKSPLCNRKLVGSRYFNKGYLAYGGKLNASSNNPRDMAGHGTHTLSTAGGNFVSNASVFGIGKGTAKGGSPKARVAAYKVCWPPIDGSECFDADIVKAFDAAISDGVDVISVSLGGSPADYFGDGIAIAAFHAVKKGVVVVASAGNSGPIPGSVSNVAPWILTVGASSIDREFEADVQLPNGKVLKGTSLSEPLPSNKLYPLITAVQAKAANASVADSILCKPGTLDPKKAKGKIVVCLRGDNARVDKGEQALLAGAVGMILANDEPNGNELLSDPHVLPATHINYTDGRFLFSYVNRTRDPKGCITPPIALLNTKPAPFMAAFSSRGPNLINPEILKPDITAPGVNIIAAYSEGTSPTEEPYDHRRTPFNVMSGTSMSCPHVSGIVGLLKTMYPDWSPAAIRSALMTSARTRDNTAHPMLDAGIAPATPFEYGSGHVRPNRAMDPGLIYDLDTKDYLNFLCAIGYNGSMIQRFSGSPYVCPRHYSIFDLNYPSISVVNVAKIVNVTRRVKNVGKPGTYSVRIRRPFGYSVEVEPKVLRFDRAGEEKSFEIKIKMEKVATKGFQFGELLWSDGEHYVRSPIVIGSFDRQ